MITTESGLQGASVRRRFSTSAASYHQQSHVQADAGKHLLALVPQAVAPSRVLEVGCGSGRMTLVLAERWRGASILATDCAPGMIAFCLREHRGNGSIQWRVADFSTEPFDPGFDLIYSNCALHWADDLARAMSNLIAAARPGAVFACSLMIEGTLKELRESRLHAAPHKMPLAELPDASAVGAAAQRAGWAPVHISEQTLSAQAASGAALLKSLHDQGVTGGRVSQAALPLTRTELDALTRYYDERFSRPDGSVFASYRIGYFVFRRPAA